MIGVVTDKVKQFMKKQADAAAKKKTEAAKQPSDVALLKNR